MSITFHCSTFFRWIVEIVTKSREIFYIDPLILFRTLFISFSYRPGVSTIVSVYSLLVFSWVFFFIANICCGIFKSFFFEEQPTKPTLPLRHKLGWRWRFLLFLHAHRLPLTRGSPFVKTEQLWQHTQDRPGTRRNKKIRLRVTVNQLTATQRKQKQISASFLKQTNQLVPTFCNTRRLVLHPCFDCWSTNREASHDGFRFSTNRQVFHHREHMSNTCSTLHESPSWTTKSAALVTTIALDFGLKLKDRDKFRKSREFRSSGLIASYTDKTWSCQCLFPSLLMNFCDSLS